uniref:Photolyase n=2 Tax=Erysiphe neolycopersici TaxID=212602 RepID=A0A7D3USA5_9PEZI|nr:photolyase [Erysiphe neolycopersici]QKE45388.1 photolyase [Erysiphe neolycopersici]
MKLVPLDNLPSFPITLTSFYIKSIHYGRGISIKLIMESKSSTTTGVGKRKLEVLGSPTASKRSKSSATSSNVPSKADSKDSKPTWANIVLRKYYPQEMSNARAQAYKDKKIPRPIDELNSALKDTFKQRGSISAGKSVAHWFKSDLRLNDNHALSAASEKSQEAGIPLIAFYIVSPEDYEAHMRAPIRVDFILRSLKILRDELAKLHIPLYVETVEKRKEIPNRIAELLNEWGAKHLFANMEYEVDELRREAGLVRNLASQGISFDVRHDTCVVPPGKIVNGTGNQYSVFTPWFRNWVAYLHSNLDLLEAFPTPSANSSSVISNPIFEPLFNHPIPTAPSNKLLSSEETKRFSALWPAGEKEALRRLEKFCKERITSYKKLRNFPAETGTSSLSPHFAVGSLSSRTAVALARERSGVKKLDGGNEGTQTWISEVAWRDFYKHVLVEWSYVCMYKPFKPEYANIEWEYNEEHLNAWKEGRTGYPIVDAAMRQLTHTGWMHNRLRMVTASFLAKHLLLDWRLGEQFFMLNLIDGDFASNNGGWGWSASSGVDPQPYFRIFNPELQSEKFDKNGDFIRKWIPELKAVKGTKPIHDPYGRGAISEAKKGGYVKRIVEHKKARDRCLARYKEGLGRASN